VNIDEHSVERLARDAGLAARVRALKDDADVVALRIERVRTWVNWLLGASIILGLAFTMVNVQNFASIGVVTYSFPWWTAWLLDPMVSFALVAVLVAEVQTARYQLRLGMWPQILKWFTLTATYVMNTWMSFSVGSPAQVVLHSVPVCVVFVATQAGPDIRDRLTEVVRRAAEEAASRVSHPVPSLEQPVAPVTPQGLTPLASSNLVVPSAIPVTQPVVQPQPLVSPLEPVPVKKPSSEAGRSDEELRDEIERIWVDLGSRPGIGRIKDALGVGSSRASRLLDSIPDPPRNGHRVEVSR
jgi:hypothetical protein